jgi:hypothetical protein
VFSKDLLPDNVWSHLTMSDLTQIMSDLHFEILETSQWMKSGPSGQCPLDSFSTMSVHCFGHILLAECLFDLILVLIAS